jgi:hypothetical protein
MFLNIFLREYNNSSKTKYIFCIMLYFSVHSKICEAQIRFEFKMKYKIKVKGKEKRKKYVTCWAYYLVSGPVPAFPTPWPTSRIPFCANPSPISILALRVRILPVGPTLKRSAVYHVHSSARQPYIPGVVPRARCPIPLRAGPTCRIYFLVVTAWAKSTQSWPTSLPRKSLWSSPWPLAGHARHPL